AAASVEPARAVVVQQFLEDQVVDLGFLAPQDHQGDDLDLGQRHRRLGRRQGAVDDDLAQGGGQHAGGFEEGDETDGFGAELLVFGVGVDADAGAGRLGQVYTAFGGFGQAVEPAECVVDVFVLEAGGREALGENVGRGTGLRRVVVFEQINEDVEHMAHCRASLHSRPAY